MEKFSARFLTPEMFQEEASRLLDSHPDIAVRDLGVSVEGRPIRLFTIGTGPCKVLLWSQMHGNESTATRLFCGLFEAIDRNQSLKESLCVSFLPMLNPDGAVRWKRENALGIDLNRDAAMLTCPESRILYDLRREIQPAMAFNLHDQCRYHAAGHSHKPATITLLAPQSDPQGTLLGNRLEAVRMTVTLYQWLQARIPSMIGRWNDDFEPRAFGETFQKEGTPTVLIEAGGYPGDMERNFVKNLVSELLLFALGSLSDKSYLDADPSVYQSIPLNRENGMLETIRPREIHGYHFQEGFRYEEQLEDGAVKDIETKAEAGDLSVFGSFSNLNL